jgi:hypothetical protein
MIDSQKAKIRKGMGARRDPTCYQVQSGIVIPAGTILRSIGEGKFAAQVGEQGQFNITVPSGAPVPSNFKRVVA